MSDDAPSKPPVRRPRKTPDQRGAVGWWAYRTMVALGLSDAQIAARVGIGSAAIRKFMGSPSGELGAESRTAMLAYYREVAARTMTPMDEPPVGFIVGASGGAAPQPSPDVSAYLLRIDALVGTVSELVAALRERTDHEVRLRAAEAELQSLREQRAAAESREPDARRAKAG